MLKKILTWGGIAFLIVFVAFRPQSAADIVKTFGSGAWDVANGFGTFLGNLVE